MPPQIFLLNYKRLVRILFDIRASFRLNLGQVSVVIRFLRTRVLFCLSGSTSLILYLRLLNMACLRTNKCNQLSLCQGYESDGQLINTEGLDRQRISSPVGEGVEISLRLHNEFQPGRN